MQCPECGQCFDPEESSTYSEWPGYREAQAAGQKILVAGIGFFVLPYICAIWTDSLLVNLLALTFIFIGPIIERGSGWAAKLAIGILLIYILISIPNIVFSVWSVLPAWNQRSGVPMILSLIHLFWSTISVVCVWRFLNMRSRLAD